MLASLLDSKIKSEAVFRTIFVFPFAVSGIVTGVVWRWLMYPSAGLNQLFDTVGLDFLMNKWYTTPKWGISRGDGRGCLAVSRAMSWLLYLAGLRGINAELKEAAQIDGASTWQLYRRSHHPAARPGDVHRLSC